MCRPDTYLVWEDKLGCWHFFSLALAAVFTETSTLCYIHPSYCSVTYTPDGLLIVYPPQVITWYHPSTILQCSNRKQASPYQLDLVALSVTLPGKHNLCGDDFLRVSVPALSVPESCTCCRSLHSLFCFNAALPDNERTNLLSMKWLGGSKGVKWVLRVGFGVYGVLLNLCQVGCK